MKQIKLIPIYFLFILSIFFFTNPASIYSQTSVCKLTFCNCCGDSLFYHLYTMEGDTLIGTFWTQTSRNGCTPDSIGNVVAGRHYYIDLQVLASGCKDDANSRIYFTGCICKTGWQEVKIPCCLSNSDNVHNFNSESINKDDLQPNQLILLQNYPNPFNPVTTIKFSISTEAFVKLVVYDINGKEISILVNGTTSAGFHEITWNAENVASGIYFYKLTAGDFTTEKKMAIIK